MTTQFAIMKTSEYRAEVKRCKAVQASHRVANGMAATTPRVLSAPKDISKLDKSDTAIYGLALAQSRLSGFNVCPHSTPDCVSSCVGKNGNGAFKSVKHARIVRTKFWIDHPQEFRFLIAHEIRSALVRHNGNVEFRLNTFSDVEWQTVAPEWFAIDGAHFYDYTKNWDRVDIFGNYSLCYSVTEHTTDEQIVSRLSAGDTVAMVINVRGGYIAKTTDLRPIPTSFAGFDIIDGDKEENRASDPASTIVGLRAKGSMLRKSMARRVDTIDGTLAVLPKEAHTVAVKLGRGGKVLA